MSPAVQARIRWCPPIACVRWDENFFAPILLDCLDADRHNAHPGHHATPHWPELYRVSSCRGRITTPDRGVCTQVVVKPGDIMLMQEERCVGCDRRRFRSTPEATPQRSARNAHSQFRERPAPHPMKCNTPTGPHEYPRAIGCDWKACAQQSFSYMVSTDQGRFASGSKAASCAPPAADQQRGSTLRLPGLYGDVGNCRIWPGWNDRSSRRHPRHADGSHLRKMPRGG